MRQALLTRLFAVVVLPLFLLAGCGVQGPETPVIQKAMQAQLDAALGAQVLKIQRLTRAGSAPMAEGDGRIVYFNAALQLKRDYDFTQWDAHSVATMTALLGAGPKGIIGVNPEGNRAGDEFGVYGSASFSRTEDGAWKLIAQTPPPSGNERPRPRSSPAEVAGVRSRAHEEPPPSPAESALAELHALLRQPPAHGMNRSERDEIVREETRLAIEASNRRLSRAAVELTLAAGPARGAYDALAQALGSRAIEADISFRALGSEGSVGNIRLLRDHTVQFALVQGDLAKSAYTGIGRFSGAPQTSLRAVASLFPETVHLVTRPDTGITSVADLQGRRVGLGPEGSGSRANANAILETHGLTLDNLAKAASLDLTLAARALADGEIDAFFTTIHAPASALQHLAANGQAQLIPIGPAPKLLASGLVPLTLPARTYANQNTPVPTLAAPALMVTREDVADAQVERMTSLLFDHRSGSTTSAAVAQIGRAHAQTGVAIPWHPKAKALLVRPGP
ncbi:MAG: TAXI family TRAP transporter solute-binding subunit [Lautropia sp.]|nr:TAXI family TRAP transporter solute-binding subunit [Lautropia sp.]